MQLRSGQQLSPAAWDCVWAKCVCVCVCAPLHVRCCYMWAYSCECCCSRRMRFTSACGKSSCFHSLSFTLRSRREAFRVVWVRWCCMQVNKSHRASSLDLSKQEKENAFLKVKGWGGERRGKGVFGWCEVRRGAEGRNRRPLRRGLQRARVWLPPLRGPDRYKLRAIKLSPCHLHRIQSRAGKGRVGSKGWGAGEGEELFR